MGTILTDDNYSIQAYPPGARHALLINPPVYDAQYWARWSQPAGLLRIASLLRKSGYRIDLIDCMETDTRGFVPKAHRRTQNGEYQVVTRDDVQKQIYHFGLGWTE